MENSGVREGADVMTKTLQHFFEQIGHSLIVFKNDNSEFF
jgi:hypothetical protein